MTIDIRCGSNADCPSGFTCEADVEHGPPTTMCESFDVSVSCPEDYETQIGYGQTFCKPYGSVSSRDGYGATFSVRRLPSGAPAAWSLSVASRSGARDPSGDRPKGFVTARGRRLGRAITGHGGNGR
jgi:Cys-rich repeat protein